MIEAYGVVEIALGFGAAWISAVLAIKWMVDWLNRRGLAVFGWWRIAAAAILAALLITGAMA